MAYLTYGFCAMTVLWLVYLLIRSRKLRLPGRLGIVRNASILEICVLGVWVSALMVLAIYAASQGVWALTLPTLFLSMGFVVVLSLLVRNSMAFTVECFVICGLFCAPRRYDWVEVTACKATKTVVPRSSKLCNVYGLKLPGRDVVLYDYTPGVCAFINELRRHKPLLSIPVPGRSRK